MPDSIEFWTERLKSPLGNLKLVASNRGIRAILWESVRSLHCKTLGHSQTAPTFLTGALRQLNEYFLRKRTSFELPLDLQGTPFQLTTWKTLLAIPYGRTLSYEDLAISMGDKNLRRAVGVANSKNPVPIVVPCHRVIGKDGSLTGFAAGIRIKKFLLDLEGYPGSS